MPGVFRVETTRGNRIEMKSGRKVKDLQSLIVMHETIYTLLVKVTFVTGTFS
jgi:hypothetical protein